MFVLKGQSHEIKECILHKAKLTQKEKTNQSLIVKKPILGF